MADESSDAAPRSATTQPDIATTTTGQTFLYTPSGVSLSSLRYDTGRQVTTDDVAEVFRLLHAAGIPACLIGVRALRYYGAGRLSDEWDICVPIEQLADAEKVFNDAENYKKATPPPPVPNSLRSVCPTFKLQDVSLYILLMPSAWTFIDPRPETNLEYSRSGLPYPKMPQFARSLLALNNGADTCDFVDGMDLDEQWGEENLDFEELQVSGIQFRHNLSRELETHTGYGVMTDVDFRDVWNHIVQTKPKRIEPLKQGRYKTCWRLIKNDMDPRDWNRLI